MDSGTASVPESWIWGSVEIGAAITIAEWTPVQRAYRSPELGVAMRLVLLSLSQNGLRYGKHTGVLDWGSVGIGAAITIAGWTLVRRAYRSPRFEVALRLAQLSLSQIGLRYG